MAWTALVGPEQEPVIFSDDELIKARAALDIDPDKAIALVRFKASTISFKSTQSHEQQEQKFRVPDIGDFDKVPVIEILVSEGDSIEAEQSLVTLEIGQGDDGSPVVACREAG